MTEELYSEIPVSETLALELGLTAEEYQRILELLGRTPTYTELGMFSVMWSEHCSYKNSLPLLKTLPRSGGRSLKAAGEENAGLIDLGGGYALAFKIESHNHPSAVEPYQGAATGVGGILRDVFTLGARPIAALNSLRFGNPDHPRTPYLLRGVVKGIGDYGNSFGVPTVAGEVFFEECYNDNPLVNAMAVGIVSMDRLVSAIAKGPGNPVMIMGNSTGRDGIHGASLLASREFDDAAEDMRPTVQVGDPFMEKKLLEATLELIDAGIVVGMQDMGAAGICSSTAETAARGGVGMRLDLDKVPLREPDMSAYEIMLSESQERMLVILEAGTEDIAQQICEKWDIPIVRFGTVTDDGMLRVYRHGRCVASLPAAALAAGYGAPVYQREQKVAAYFAETSTFDPSSLPEPASYEEVFWQLLSSPNIASKRWVFEQYDSQVGTNTVQKALLDSAVIRLKERPPMAIALTTDCNSRYVYLHPRRGAQIAVAEAARNVACAGAEPVGITNCLNFGNPYDPEIYWQFAEAIAGMAEACRTFEIPVTGGNVSFHNESQNYAVFPTPTIGMVGILPDVDKVVGGAFLVAGDLIALVGPGRRELGGSEYLFLRTGKVTGLPPTIDCEEERRLQKFLFDAAQRQLLRSAHDCAEGGLAVALAEKCIASPTDMGAIVQLHDDPSAALLFGESQTRVLLSFDPQYLESLQQLARQYALPFRLLGTVVPEIFEIKGVLKTSIKKLRRVYEATLPAIAKS